MPLNITSCIFCKHWDRESGQFFCTAFPQGIPNEIIYGQHDHITQFAGDNGIQFEPLPEYEEEFRGLKERQAGRERSRSRRTRSRSAAE